MSLKSNLTMNNISFEFSFAESSAGDTLLYRYISHNSRPEIWRN